MTSTIKFPEESYHVHIYTGIMTSLQAVLLECFISHSWATAPFGSIAGDENVSLGKRNL